jgi:hydroxyacylglutathione hydrolase
MIREGVAAVLLRPVAPVREGSGISAYATTPSKCFYVSSLSCSNEVMRIVENLYGYVWQGSDNNCNCYVFKGVLKGEKHLVIDPGHLVTPFYHQQGLGILLQRMAEDGMDGDAIGCVVLTHGHPDHCEAAVPLREENNALVALHEADLGMFSNLGGKADILLDEGVLQVGSDISLQVIHSPGHTPGHVTLYWHAQKVLIAGDCIFYRSVGRADLPGGNHSVLGKTIDRLSKLDSEYLLCGHPYGNPGIISGREEVQENFRYIRNLF